MPGANAATIRLAASTISQFLKPLILLACYQITISNSV